MQTVNEAMGKWIKDNLVLVSGILLPMLLIGGFFLLNRVPGILTEPPTHDFLLVAYQYDYQNPGNSYLSFEVHDGKLTGRASPRDENHNYINRNKAGIFLYRAKSNTFEEIPFDLPAGLNELEESIAIDLTSLAHLQLDKRNQSPDGYQFEFLGYSGRGGLLGEIFGMGHSYESRYVLKKGSNFINLPEPVIDPNHYQNDMQFMGWVVQEGSSS